VRVLAILNPRSGSGGDAGFYDFARALGQEGAEITLRFLSAESLIDQLVSDASTFDMVVAGGGDGTVSAVLYSLRSTDVPVLVYPLGTANLLALNLKLPTDPLQLARIALRGCVARIDLGEIERDLPDGTTELCGFVNATGAGYDAAIMESAAALKTSFGAAAYVVGAMQNLTPTMSEFVIEIDGERIETDGIAVLVVNFGKLQFDITLTHGSDPADGLFEVAVIRSRNVAGLLPAVWSALIDRVAEHPDRGPGLDFYTGREVSVSAYPPLRMQYDGEVMDAFTPFKTRVLPLAARLLVPEFSPYVSRCPQPGENGSKRRRTPKR